VALPSSIMILFSQVNRVTRSGQVLGAEQRVSAMDAIRSHDQRAYQYFEERTQGLARARKLADFVSSTGTPDVTRWPSRTYKVVETIKEGRTIYRLSPWSPGSSAAHLLDQLALRSASRRGAPRRAESSR